MAFKTTANRSVATKQVLCVIASIVVELTDKSIARDLKSIAMISKKCTWHGNRIMVESANHVHLLQSRSQGLFPCQENGPGIKVAFIGLCLHVNGPIALNGCRSVLLIFPLPNPMDQ